MGAAGAGGPAPPPYPALLQAPAILSTPASPKAVNLAPMPVAVPGTGATDWSRAAERDDAGGSCAVEEAPGGAGAAGPPAAAGREEGGGRAEEAPPADAWMDVRVVARLSSLPSEGAVVPAARVVQRPMSQRSKRTGVPVRTLAFGDM